MLGIRPLTLRPPPRLAFAPRRSVVPQHARMSFTKDTRTRLRDGHEIPIIGFGTYQITGRDAYNATKWALEAGYRHVDSAEWYSNEPEVGRAIQDFCTASGTPRAEVYYTTKLQTNRSRADALEHAHGCLDACGLGHIDLFLLHSPIGGPAARLDAWRGALDARDAGIVKSVGVSNFSVRHLQEMIDAGVELPAVNQIDLHPFMTRTDVVGFCKQHDIALEAWAPLVEGMRFRHPTIVKLAKKHGKEPAQILLRYSLQKGFIALPKSSKKARIQSNLNVYDFEIAEAEMAELDALDEYLITDWDPTDTP
ncbi:Aldo/keto reductase [Epithele typhae]|uniref:Aldo/keto reductase n=1 Tax=Epithele typhae TaxID=378194 RepID=UPI002007BFC2|nr:Aldo/keto reductase [Epithele typhae]KAH9945425.1 Aldo/keto reductase [Epithele typhae]